MTDVKTIQDMKASVKSIQDQLKKLEETHQKEAEKLFKQESAFLFEQHPKLESFCWNQCTPYFNDGEPCEFSAHTDEIGVNGDSPYGEDSFYLTTVETKHVQRPNTDYRTPYKDRYDTIPNPDYDPENAAIQKSVTEFLSQFNDSTLERLFGDHAQVTITKSGVNVEEYDHD